MFRQVDRADFMTFPDDQDSLEAYEDHAWRRGKLHLSAPCIYTRAMEALQFKRGEWVWSASCYGCRKHSVLAPRTCHLSYVEYVRLPSFYTQHHFLGSSLLVLFEKIPFSEFWENTNLLLKNPKNPPSLDPPLLWSLSVLKLKLKRSLL